MKLEWGRNGMDRRAVKKRRWQKVGLRIIRVLEWKDWKEVEMKDRRAVE